VKTKGSRQNMEKPRVVTDYKSGMGCADLSDANLMNYNSTRKKDKKVVSKTFLSFD
jgi:hypothetical protein